MSLSRNDKELYLKLLEEKQRRYSRASHLHFMAYCWRGMDAFIPGFHTRKICERIDRAISDYKDGKSTYLLINVHPRAGKALEVNTLIPTPHGYTKIVDLKIGDEVFDENGDICHIIAKTPIFYNRECYNISTADGESIIADAEHLWLTRQCRHQNKHKLHTSEWLFKSQSKRRPMINTQGAISTPNAELPIKPYTLGVWLGDGNSSLNAITCSYNDIEIMANIMDDGYSVRQYKSKSNTTGHFQIGGGGHLGAYHRDGLLKRLKGLGVYKNKHIPMIYKRAGYSQRLALLQGLIDTDGYVSEKGHIEFCNTNKTLAYDVYELVSSLGVKCTISESDATLYGRFISKKYRVCFYMKGAARLKRKAANTRDGVKNPGRYISVSRHGICDTICIQVSSKSGMFLCGRSMLPTHNSEIVSKHLGPHFLGMFPRAEVMQVSFAADKATAFSADARSIINSDAYRVLYPDIALADDTNRKDHYLTTQGGGLMATGLHGHLTGSGFSLGILDDYCSGREEAESAVQRESAWQAFTNDFMTRMAPHGIVIVLATQWHVDDISGRIRKAMRDDEHFPRFEELVFPARAEDYKGEGKYPGKYLFSERYSDAWYQAQYAVLGKYSAAALFDCNPYIRSGGRFNLDTIEWIDEIPDNKSSLLRWCRVWDLAHTAKQRGGDDPDWTSGTKLAFERRPGDPVPHLWVKSVYRTREDAAKRDAEIKAVVNGDGPTVRQGVEVSLDAKDAYQYLRNSMPNISFSPIQCKKGDKATRAVPLEPIFEAPGHVHVVRGPWNDAWVDELLRFDGLGKDHDDQVDNLSAGYQWQMTQYIGVG